MQAQTIRGNITDAETGETLPGATVALKETGLGTITNADGDYILSQLETGRYSVEASYVGYEPMLYKEILIVGAKEVVLNFQLQRNTVELDEITVQPRTNKEAAVNKMALVGARMLSMEEASRYAGGYSDPARLVTAFAGVAGSPDNNGVSVHGNAPQSLLWKLEGVEINSPNHFTDAFNMGTGVVSALNANVLGNSDFFSGAFTAEYTNALSGVFDMRMREGNNEQYEHAAQVGTLGIELTSEGPLSRKSGASYIFNYRYSFTSLARQIGLLTLDGDQADFQDLSFKFNFPTKRAGTFSIFGLGLKDKYWVDMPDPSEWESIYDQEYDECRQTMLVGGIGHQIHLNGWNWKTTLAASYFKNEVEQSYYEADATGNLGTQYPYLQMGQDNSSLTFTTNLQKRLAPNFLSKVGATYTEYFFDLDLKMADSTTASALPSDPVYQADDHTGLLNAYITNSWNLSPALTFNFGLASQFFTLNQDWTLEPRASLQWKADSRNTFSLGYGLHSKKENLDVYFVKDDAGAYVNKNLKLSKAHHFLLSYLHKFSDNLNLRVEAYYQQLYDLPVGVTGTYCIINRKDFYVDQALTNQGKGRNYGIDITLERYMSGGYYYTVNGSLYKAEYKAADNIWRNTRYDRTYLFKILGGKEWLLGKQKKNVLSVSGKFTLQGGMRHTPTDLAASRLLYESGSAEVAYDNSQAFSLQYSPLYIVDLTVSYKICGKKVDHTIAFEGLNIFGKQTPYIDIYNYKKDEMETYMNGMTFPNIYYRISF
ncbi:MAG: TonB-dependent receptor [Bacteroides sp.]|nr:TonB-dependent receptor [Bacteroides sp.]